MEKLLQATGNRDFSFLVMMILTRMLLVILLVFVTNAESTEQQHNDVYSFSATDLDGNLISFEKYRGTVLLVVNVASECTLTDSNYQQLNELYDRYREKGLRIAAFPSNQFGGQEPGNSDTIKQFITNKHVQFDVYAKVDVNGENAHPLYKWLKSRLSGILFTDFIKWNFTKFLLDRNGQPVKRYGPLEQPKNIESDIKKELAKSANMPKNSQPTIANQSVSNHLNLSSEL